MESIKIIIHTDPRSKKNSMRIVTRGKYPKLLPSAQYEAWRNECLAVINNDYPQNKIGINYPVNLKIVYYMKTRRKVDITNLHSAVSDMLVDAGVIADDNRDICAAYDGSRVFYDKEDPRCEITITKLDEEYKQWKEQ